MTRKSGRPENQSLMLARLQGDMTYHGKACKRCGGVERYVRGGGACVTCQRAYSIESRAAMKRIAAEAEGFTGTEITTIFHEEAAEFTEEMIDAIERETQCQCGYPATPCDKTKHDYGHECVAGNERPPYILCGGCPTPDDCRGVYACREADNEQAGTGWIEAEIERAAGEQPIVNDDSDLSLDTAAAPRYLSQDEIPQPWD